MLQAKGLPFDPEIMLHSNWKEELIPVLGQIPDMQVSRAVGDRIEDVQMADALYLPEKVKFTGDTIIIARKVVFEGHDAILKGSHNIYYFPIEAEGALGTTLKTAMKRQMGTQFIKAKFGDPVILERFKPQLLEKDWSLTIDSSGYGYKDWLEDQKKKADLQESYRASIGETWLNGRSGGPNAIESIPYDHDWTTLGAIGRESP